MTTDLQSELTKVGDRLHKMITQNTDLKIKLRQMEEVSASDIEQKMIKKVSELEKSNFETILKTYKSNISFFAPDS